MIEYALIAAVTAMIAVAAIVSAGADATVPLHRVQMALQAVLHGAHGGGGGICAPPAPHP